MILNQLCDSRCVQDFWKMYATNMTNFMNKIIFLSENCNGIKRVRREPIQLRWNELSQNAARKLDEFTNQFNEIATNCSAKVIDSNTENENQIPNNEDIHNVFSLMLEKKLIMIFGIMIIILFIGKCVCKR